MKPSVDEQFVVKLLKDRYGVALQKVPESTSKTPDFEFCVNGERLFIAELKTLDDCEPSAERGWIVSQEHIGVKKAHRKDNSVARVASRIHEAYKQLCNYPVPKVLILLNKDMLDVGDLEEAFTGQMVYGDLTQSYVNTASRKIAEGQIKDEKDKIDLYIWIDRKQTIEVIFRFTTDIGHDLSCRLFKTPPLEESKGTLGGN